MQRPSGNFCRPTGMKSNVAVNNSMQFVEGVGRGKADVRDSAAVSG